MTELEALKASLKAAVRDGDRDLAKQLTKAVISRMYPAHSALYGKQKSDSSPKGTIVQFDVGKRQVEGQ